MKYVFYQKHYEYGDEDYIYKNGRSIHSVNEYSSEAIAKQSWAELEKQELYFEDHMDIRLWLQPIEQNSIDTANYDFIFNFLLKKGITPKVTLKELHSLLQSIYSVTSKELPVLDLPNDAFIELILELGINQFLLSKYESAKNWVLYWNSEKTLSKEKRFLTFISEYNAGNVVLCESNQDALFQAKEFRKRFDKEITTQYTEKDRQSSILQSLLKQNADIFIIQENSISYAPLKSRYNDDDTIKNNIASLRAVNDLLEYPFFEIRNLSAEEVLSLNKMLAENV